MYAQRVAGTWGTHKKSSQLLLVCVLLQTDIGVCVCVLSLLLVTCLHGFLFLCLFHFWIQVLFASLFVVSLCRLV